MHDFFLKSKFYETTTKSWISWILWILGRFQIRCWGLVSHSRCRCVESPPYESYFSLDRVWVPLLERKMIHTEEFRGNDNTNDSPTLNISFRNDLSQSRRSFSVKIYVWKQTTLILEYKIIKGTSSELKYMGFGLWDLNARYLVKNKNKNKNL